VNGGGIREARTVVEMRERLAWVIAIIIMVMGGCTAPAGKGPAPQDLLPTSGAVAGWERSGEAEVYVPDNLFDYMDGQAELFFVYRFERLAVQEYQRGDEGPIIVEPMAFSLSTPPVSPLTWAQVARRNRVGSSPSGRGPSTRGFSPMGRRSRNRYPPWPVWWRLACRRRERFLNW